MNNGLKRKKMVLILFTVSSLLSTGAAITAREAGYVGSEKCRQCHADLAKTFSKNIHSHGARYGVTDVGCEGCHGPGSVHAESGDKAAIVNPAKVDSGVAVKTCLECHSSSKTLMFWTGSAHSNNRLSCTNCHQVHMNREKLLAKANEKDVCFTCHPDVRAAILQRSKHPLRDSSAPHEEGKMTCYSCHNPHGARSEKLINARSVNDKCFECHTEKKAPVLWEHSPVKEDCLICHAAHGSSNDKLLVTKIPRLCQKCHMQGRHQSGALSTNSIFALNRSCLNCHPMVHGSNHPSGPVLQR